ncbi:hypothetical protein CWS02_10595 [Enterobacter sp. EA-1]|nr:hypothetical protein CWS02_10595 [Enterobacter sp. EA-1]
MSSKWACEYLYIIPIRFVSDGSTADVDLGNISIGGAMRDSKLIYVDGNSASTTATVKGNINLEVFSSKTLWMHH